MNVDFFNGNIKLDNSWSEKSKYNLSRTKSEQPKHYLKNTDDIVKSDSTRENFSKMLQNLKEYKPANYVEKVERDEEITVTNRMLSDGSVLTTVTKGGEIISQSRSSATIKQKDVKVLSTKTEVLEAREESTNRIENSNAGISEISNINIS